MELNNKRGVRIPTFQHQGSALSGTLWDASVKPSTAPMRVFNLSRSGAFLAGENNFTPGSEVSCEIANPEIGGITVRARVVWQRPASESPSRPQGVGIVFDEFERDSQLILNEMITRLLGELKLGDVAAAPWVTAADAATALKHFALNGCPVFNADDPLYRLFEVVPYIDHAYFLVQKAPTQWSVVQTVTLLPYWAEFVTLHKDKIEQGFIRSLSAVAHDLRTPLAIISTSNQMLLSHTIDPREYVQSGIPDMVEENCRFIFDLIDDLLALSVDGTKSEHFKLSDWDLVAVCKSSIKALKPLARRRAQKLVLQSEAERLDLHSDRTKVSRVLHNLINNAIKFSNKETTITVKLKQTPTHAVLTVKDQGSGIPTAKIPFIFEEFVRLKENSQRASGFGLGLAIVRKIVKALGGTVDVKSQEGKGTAFIVSLPLRTRIG